MKTYLAGQSVGQPFDTGSTRTVAVTAEALDVSSGFEGETVVYTATVKDDQGEALPIAFVVDLLINGTEIVSDQVLDAVVYDPITFLLTLSWIVPAGEGSFTVKLSWDEQKI